MVKKQSTVRWKNIRYNQKISAKSVLSALICGSNPFRLIFI
ncbi:Uncharacterized protein dnm_093720 [Desulfonema magnum]|uniref:Uncharacterized protein n=1 Tax=Desulfonema magnum TaxID=45655 RepID=A0A975BWY5_9BACT|nr:Uncharacterized protein dnm_093720 [Desulfonema magnum]